MHLSIAARFRVSPRAAWCCALLALALFSHAPALPPLAWLALALAAASRLLPRGRLVEATRIAFLLLVFSFCFRLWGWQAENTVRLVLLLALTLKWAEAATEREQARVVAVALVTGALGLLRWNEWVGVLLLFALPWCAMNALSGAARENL
ncbi:MAG: hypothetical protein LBC37_00030, partial [Zoogloeaceae bacterium]|nr:hypothetical protein [Zoogloeaceae bacterium]